ncbi:hypothetical protein ABH935_007033 [Catenulispora sp. GAS73]|uniref:hypothetical protein n=1 Tax=Catenulispora sp. GAS73 TaxID=3156269 RepID=UPI003511C5C3
MNTTTTRDTEPGAPDTEGACDAPPETAAASPHAVIACDYPDHRIWAGRILHHAQGPSATARLLYELLLTYPKKNRIATAATDLIVRHPSGWQHLGPDPTATSETTRRARRGQLGRCLCHHPDGSPTQAVIDEALAAMTRTEWRQPANPLTVRADDAPRLITPKDAKRDPRIAYVFHLQGSRLHVLARDGATDNFAQAGTIQALPGIDFDALGPDLDTNAATIAARTPADGRSERVADRLIDAANHLATIPAYHELVLHEVDNMMAGLHEGAAAKLDAESALARTAGVPSSELPAFLARASRGEQLRLLRLTAHQLAPRLHAAPATDLGTIANRQDQAGATTEETT